jgi:hypothetical protein
MLMRKVRFFQSGLNDWGYAWMAKEHRHRRRYAAAGHLSKGNVASSALSARIPCRLV